MKRTPVLLLLLALLVTVLGTRHPAQAQASDLFFSEYIEGSSLNKALEIYNGTGAPVDLAAGNYTIEISFNGGTALATINLTGVIAAGDVHVVADDGADPAILAQADQTPTNNFFNGDDAITLQKAGVVIDSIGQLGVDPGSEWGSGDTSTADHTLRRLADICTGDSNPSDPFDPATEWAGYPQNTFDGLGSHTANCDSSGAPQVLINEIRIDQPSTDVDEYFELVGAPGTALDGLAYLVIGDGSASAGSGVIEEVTSLSGQSIGAGGYFVAAESSFTLGTADLITDLNFENSDNVTHLLVWNFSGSDGDDLDTDDDGTLDVTPWQQVVDLIALVEEENPPSGTEYHYGPPSVGPDGSFVPGHVYRCEEGWQIGEFGGGDDTPGADNACDSGGNGGACGEPATLIHEIQGSGAASPLDGQTVTIEGIVVGDFQGGDGDTFNSDLEGFYVQEEQDDFDAVAETSEGIFVFAPGAQDVQQGDVVRVTGTVDEFFNLTELTGVGDVQVCDTLPVPEPVEVTPFDVSVFENYEGMLVEFPQNLAISEYFNFDRFGEIVLCELPPGFDRLFQPTAVAEPGSPEAEAIAEYNASNCITLDDARSQQNPDPARHPNGLEFTLDNRFRGGDIVQNATGILDYRFSEYRIQPTEGADYTQTNPRPDSPEDVGGNIQVASFNVLNYFTTLGSRGADTPEEFQRQQAKIVAALAAIDADIFGLIEIENNDEAVQNLVDALNAEVGAGTYDYIMTGPFGTDEIKQALIYKPATVSPVGDYAVLDDPAFTNPLDYDTPKNRPALAQSFIDDQTGGIFTVVVNHLKSKGSGCGAGDDDSVQGNCTLTRALAADYLVDWLASDPTGVADDDYLIIGDLNSYDKEDPIDQIREGADDILGTDDDYTDLILQYQGEYAYSYVFDGQFGYLDYAMASSALLPEVTGTTVWHINADEPDILDYDMTFKQDAQDALYEANPYRSSDHDPVIVGLSVCDEIAPVASVTVSPDILWPANHQYVDVMATVSAVDNLDPEPTVTLLSVTSNEPDDSTGDGNTIDDIVILDDTHFQLRAERDGAGEGRIYTITYLVSDDCGNTVLASATVTVPKSQGRP